MVWLIEFILWVIQQSVDLVVELVTGKAAKHIPLSKKVAWFLVVASSIVLIAISVLVPRYYKG
jgi:hypothetical protein